MSAGQFIVNCKFQAHMQQTNVHLSLSFFFFSILKTQYTILICLCIEKIIYVIVYPVESLKFLVYSSFCGLSTFEWFIRVCDFCR